MAGTDTAVSASQVASELLPSVAGLDYGPYRPGESPDLLAFPGASEFREDLAQLSTITDTIRTYSVTNGFDAISAIAADFGISVVPGAFLNNEGFPWAPAVNQDELDSLVALLNGSTGNIPFAVVGSEAILGQGFSQQELIERIEAVRAAVPSDVLLTTAEPWHLFLENPASTTPNALGAAVDIIFANVHPYYEVPPQAIGNAVDFVVDRYMQLQAAYPDKPVIISETGWPTAGFDRPPAFTSVANQEAFLQALLATDIPFFDFEAYDELWKGSASSPEQHWGLFEEDHQTAKHGITTFLDRASLIVPAGPSDGDDLLSGTGAAETLAGALGNDLIRVGAGDDSVWGEAGNDLLYGDSGNDRLFGNPGNDTLMGGDGNDTLRAHLDDDRLGGELGNDVLFGGAADDSIEAGAGDDIASGNSGADTISGGTGNDTLRGQGGADQIDGGDGDDRVLGMQGADLLFGGAGNDQLTAGPANDTLTGGDGIDIFIFAPGQGDNLVTDFTVGVDLISAVGVTDLTALRLVDDAEGVRITLAVDGDAPTLAITLSGVTASQLGSDDFFFS